MKNRTTTTRLAGMALFLSLAVGQLVHAQKDTNNALFWEISGNGLASPSHLFGTYHLLGNGYLADLPRVEAAFAKADGIVVETELDSSKLAQMFSMMIMKDTKLSDLVSKDDYEMLAGEIQQSTGAPIDLIGQFKPAFITVMLTVTYARAGTLSKLEQYAGTPLDSYFAATGRQKKKAVSTFETMEEQMRLLFDHYPVEEQARQLVEFVKSKDEMATVQDELLSLYLRQDLGGLYKLYRKYEKRFGDTSWLLDDRNVNWMTKIPAMLSDGNRFIAVGALHLAGNKGLIRLLREAGYTMTPLSVK